MLPAASDPRLQSLPADARDKILLALEASHARPNSEQDIGIRMREIGQWTDALVAAGFPLHAPKDSPFHRRFIPLATALTPAQRAAAEIFADVPGVHVDRVGIYSAAWVRRRWLGIDPPGVLFREVQITIDGVEQRVPQFHALRTVVRADSNAAIAMLRAMPIADRVEMLCDLALACIDYFEMHVNGLLFEARAELEEWGRY